jgi:thiol-disulfide isomerase/thioredoxin
VWWVWQAPKTGYLTVSTAGSQRPDGADLDTLLGIYTGLSVGALTEIASNDDDPDVPQAVTSKVSLSVTAGTTYRIAVDGLSAYGLPADTGTIRLNLGYTAYVEPSLAPSWGLPGIDGKLISSTQFSGKVVLLNFWATWCESCLAEIPHLIELQGKYATQGFTVVGISVDDSRDGIHPPTEVVAAFAASHGMNYPIVMSRPSEAVENAFGGLTDTPTSILVDRQNHVVRRLEGTQTLVTFESYLKPLLNANPSLGVAFSHGQIRLSWPVTTTQFALETADNLSTPAWATVSAPSHSDGSQQFVELPLDRTQRFYRLKSQ